MNLSAAIRKLVADAEAIGYTVKAAHEQCLTLSLPGTRPTTFAVHFDDGRRFSAGYRYQGLSKYRTAEYRSMRALRADMTAAAAGAR